MGYSLPTRVVKKRSAASRHTCFMNGRMKNEKQGEKNGNCTTRTQTRTPLHGVPGYQASHVFQSWRPFCDSVQHELVEFYQHMVYETQQFTNETHHPFTRKIF